MNLLYNRQIFSFLNIYLGGGMRYVENHDHIKNKNDTDFWLRSGVSLSFEFLFGKK
jgi:hypothetical protein